MRSKPLAQFRDRDLSLWQSAVDQVVSARRERRPFAAGGVPVATRPELEDATIRAATQVAEAVSRGDTLMMTGGEPGTISFGVEDVVTFCAATALKLARAQVKALLTGDKGDLKKWREQIGTKFDTCDPRWAECVAAYVAFQGGGGKIPYRAPGPDSFIIDGRLPANAKVAIVGDWGTGDDAAKAVIGRIAARKPDVVFHLGDIYYSGAEHEVREYFYNVWQQALGLPAVAWGEKLTDLQARPCTFTLSGNHDMYAGGGPYYTLLDMLGQPASCFCLRNDSWQFVALDTGLHDSRPAAATETYLEPAEAAWLARRVADGQAANRKTFLLSHHQLYSAYDKFRGKNVNESLYEQVKDVLGGVTAWMWGHEHDLIIHEPFPAAGPSVRGRCIGHGAFPVGVDEPNERDLSVPINEAVRLSPDADKGLFQHGYAWMELDDGRREAHLSYYQYDWEAGGDEQELFTETL